MPSLSLNPAVLSSDRLAQRRFALICTICCRMCCIVLLLSTSRTSSLGAVPLCCRLGFLASFTRSMSALIGFCFRLLASRLSRDTPAAVVVTVATMSLALSLRLSLSLSSSLVSSSLVSLPALSLSLWPHYHYGHFPCLCCLDGGPCCNAGLSPCPGLPLHSLLCAGLLWLLVAIAGDVVLMLLVLGTVGGAAAVLLTNVAACSHGTPLRCTHEMFSAPLELAPSLLYPPPLLQSGCAVVLLSQVPLLLEPGSAG